MTAHRCPCGLPANDASICPRCLYDIERDLAEIPALVDQLDITLSRQGASGRRDGGRSAETPMPYNVKASTERDNLHGTLAGWVRDIHGDTDDFYPADDTNTLARWLLSRLEQIRQHPAADQIHDELGYAVSQARHAVDRPAERIYAGPCLADTDTGKCPEDLYAKPGATVVTCRACDTSHDIEERRTWLLAAAEDHLDTATHIARAVTGLGAPVTPERIRKWAERGRVTAHSVDLDGHPLYRVGDVIDLLAADRERESRRSA